MSFESAHFLLKIKMFFMCETFDVADVEGGRVKFDVAKFVMGGRSGFSLIELKDDRGLAMMLEVDLHFRVFDEVMSWLFV